MSKVSVIVPVYNVEKYLDQCIKSIIEQFLIDIEIILINDGSKDRSREICEFYTKIDDRIKLYNKENEGVSKAREFGLNKATSEYICFVDSDDFIEKDYCLKLYNAIKDNNADLAECSYNLFNGNKKIKKHIYNENFILTKTQFVDEIIKNTIINGTVAVLMWNKIYKKDYIEKFVHCYGHSQLEDYLFNMQYYKGVNKYVYIDEPLINYRYVNNSLSHTFNKNFYEILKQVQEHKEAFMKDMDLCDNECLNLSYRWFYKYTINGLINMFSCNIYNTDKIDFACSIINDFKFRDIVKSYECDSKDLHNLKSEKHDLFLKSLLSVARKRRFNKFCSVFVRKITNPIEFLIQLLKTKIFSVHKRFNVFLVNTIYSGTKSKNFERKRKLLNAVGYSVGENTKIVGPIEWDCEVQIGDNCWIGKNSRVLGGGKLIVGNNCDFATDVIFVTGSHKIGDKNRRAGWGENHLITVGNGVWVGARSTIVNNTKIGDSCVIAACACVTKDVENNMLIGGVPAKVIRELKND